MMKRSQPYHHLGKEHLRQANSEALRLKELGVFEEVKESPLAGPERMKGARGKRLRTDLSGSYGPWQVVWIWFLCGGNRVVGILAGYSAGASCNSLY